MKTEVLEKRQTLKGRLTSKDAKRSVEGLKVSAYVAGTKKLLGTAIADEEGRYRFEFEHKKPMNVELLVTPNVSEKLISGLPAARKRIPPAELSKKVDLSISEYLWPIWDKITKVYVLFGNVMHGIPDPDNEGDYLDLTPIPDVTVHIYDVGSWWDPFPMGYTKHKLGTATTSATGSFFFEFNWTYYLGGMHPIWMPPDTKPDILIEVTQRVNGVDVLLYEDQPDVDTRWNIDQFPPGIPIIIEGDMILPDEELTPIDTDFEFHGIGRVLISELFDGYADTSGSTPDVVKAKNSPFGGTIDIKGQFNNELQGNFYRVLFAKWEDDTTPPESGDFTPMLDEGWNIAMKVDDEWTTVYRSPGELGELGGGFYQIPDYTDTNMTSKEILVRWRTWRKDGGAPRYPDGKYSLRLEVYDEDGAAILATTSMAVQVDNTEPIALIRENIQVENGSLPLCTETTTEGELCDSPEVCGIVYLEPGKKLKFRLDAYDEANHFRRYRVTYRGGHGETGIIRNWVSWEDENDHGLENELVEWDISPSSALTQCGYQIHLKVWDRTINGYGYIHEESDFINMILLDLPS